MADWIYILNPLRDVLDQEPADKDAILALAEEEPEAEFWLGRRNRMVPGDRVWFYFSPDAAVAAVGEVDEEPRVDTEAGDGSYLVPVTLLTEATKALHRSPVTRDELGLGQVRSVQKVKPAALPLLLERAGL
ncbi:EVE domain-containing protein [Streptomyces sp. XM83C]|uniref:EVE domain-containing protein n=1 Tax=Streptomyces thermocoprophilus TaxID=78356 RepID=A0ABV5VBM6_9ACTN|nr:EVE domain-containing protein [Streptomyces sp. XM83C]MCK1819591.1 EVE domain-containing protein [Streptomyces sp. XM83C]